MDENIFLCGVNFGREYTVISYWNYSVNAPQVIDVSGGYGIEALPSCITFVPDYGDWIFGDYALNEISENAVFFDKIIENTGKDVFYSLENKKIHNKQLLSMLIVEVISQIKNVNPNNIIKKLTVALNKNINEDVKQEFIYAFEKNGVEKEKLIFKNETECVLRYCCHYEDVFAKNLCIMDIGSRELKVTEIDSSEKGLYKIKERDFNNLSSKNIDMQIYSFFYDILKEEKKEITKSEMRGLEIFTREHKSIAFKNSNSEFVNLYYNFCYPPFKKSVRYSEIKNCIKLFENELLNIICSFGNYEDNLYILSGGIFEQADFKNNFIKKAKINCVNKKTKALVSLGAVIYSAENYGIIDNKKIDIINDNKICFDLGIMADRFIPIIEEKDMVLNKFYYKYFIIPEEIDDSFEIELYKKEKNKPAKLFEVINVEGFPKRKKGAVKIKISLKYTEDNVICAEIADMGFGDFYNTTNYTFKYNCKGV